MLIIQFECEKSSMKPVIQVAGILDHQEQNDLYDAGVRWFGYPFFISHHRPENNLHQLKSLLIELPDDAVGVWIHYLSYADTIISLAKALGCDAIQCHGKIEPQELCKIKKALPNLFIIKSIVMGLVDSEFLADYVKRYELFVDAFITDTYDPITGASGATGLTHCWDDSKLVVDISNKPVILAGGLNTDNVAEAIRSVRPAGVDAHTGLENTKGRKSIDSVKEFIAISETSFSQGPF